MWRKCNVSVPQVLESEKKLQLISLLNLNLKHIKFTIKDLNVIPISKLMQIHNLSSFDPVLDSVLEYEINVHDSYVLLFTSGYEGNSNRSKLKC